MSMKMSTRTMLFGLLFLCIFDHIEASAQRVTRDDEWVLTASYGVPVWIAFNDTVGPTAFRRSIFVFIEGQHFTPDNIRTLFTNLATQYKQPDWLYITAFDDKKMLQRAINTSTSGMIIDWANTPEGREAAKKWALEYEPLPSGYHRARYTRIQRDYYGQKYFEEEYSYSPDPAKSEMITVVLQGKPKLSPYSGNLNSDLLIAAKEGDATKVAALIEKGANVNSRDKDGDTALMIASLSARDITTVKVLLARGADVNAKSDDNDTALIYAAADDDSEILQALLEKGAEMNHQNDNGYSPLIMASVNELRLPNSKFLLTHGADLSLKNDNGETALTMAVNGSVIELIKLLLQKGASINDKDKDGNTPLMKAAGPRQAEIVKLLVEGGADVNTRNALSESPLMKSFSKEAASILLAHLANVNAKNNDGDTALMYAARWSDAERAKLLVERGADLHAKNKKGETALDITKRGYGNNNAMLDLLEGAAAKLSEPAPISGSPGLPLLVVKRDPKSQCCEEVSSVAFSPDGNLVASKLYHSSFAGNQGVVLWDVTRGRLIRSIEGPPHGVIEVVVSPDGKRIVSKYGKAWDAESGKALPMSGVPDDSAADVSIYSAALNGGLIATAEKRIGERNQIAIREDRTGALRRSFVTDTPVEHLILGADSRRLVGVIRAENAVVIWDADTGEVLRKITLVGPGFYDLAYSNDGNLLAASYGDPVKQDFADVFDPGTGKSIYRISGHSSVVFSLAFSTDGKLLASGSGDTTIKLWEAGSGKLLRTLEGHTQLVRSVAFSPDNRLLASGGGKNETKIWSVRTGKLLVTFQAFNDGSWIAYTPDGYYNCSEGASKYITWRIGNRIVEEPKYEAQFLKPEIVAERLRD
jgi:ankyrin repeat protein/WD40 repeat protein